MMKNLFPYPLQSIALLVTWLLLNQTIAPAHLLLGAVLGISIPWFTRRLQYLAPAPFRRPHVMVKLIVLSTIEIIRSCFNVTRVILFNTKGVHTRFIRIPLDMKNSHGLAALSCIVNSTPGTVWCELLPDSHVLVLHVFDLQDEQWWINTIKGQIEKPLMELFED